MRNTRTSLLAALAISLSGAGAFSPAMPSAVSEGSAPIEPKQRGTHNRKRPMNKINRRAALKLRNKRK